ncbi:MAG TPA: 2-isopropylmalate synthase [Myxococcota bacterium]|nr:2-isopropylmalate synthase [Myxococcota bacterium]
MQSQRVTVFDTTLRDGEQAAGVFFSKHAKVEIAELLDAMKVDVIEAGFPISSPGERASVVAVAAQVRHACVCALARAVPDEVDATWSAIARARNPRIHVFLSSSEIHLAHQLRRGADEVVAMARAAVARARAHVANVEFSCMDATRSDPEFVARVVRAALAAGASTINLPDTVGCARPDQVAEMFRGLYARVPELCGAVASFHGQDDLGMATANSLAAIAAGARQVELAVNGLGERAGNTAFEEVVMALRLHGAALGVHTGVDTRGIWRVSQAVARHSGIAVPANKAIVGGNAFRHASGIHQDGVLKRRDTYEAIDPAEIGHPTGSEIVLGKLSGRHGFAARVRALGIELDGVALDRAFARFQRVADQRGGVGERELVALCRERDEVAPGAPAVPA